MYPNNALHRLFVGLALLGLILLIAAGPVLYERAALWIGGL